LASRLFLLVAALLIGLAAGCATPAAHGDDTVSPVEVAPGVWVVRGAAGDAEPANQGRVGNAGFIVGPRGVLAVDSGTSARQGRALLAAIARVTAQPVRLLVLTHVRQEAVFGAAAFQERGIPVAMHADAARLMAARCENCLKTLRRLLGDDAMALSRVVKPDVLLEGDAMPTDIGRPVRLLHLGHSSGPGDLVVFDETSRTLFAGGLAGTGHVPDIQDGRLPQWHAALRALDALQARRLVPGRGPVAAAPEAIAATARYLSAVEARVRDMLRADTALSQVADAADMPEYAAWEGYDTVHRRNASVLFVRLEAEALFGPTSNGAKKP
jgi:glyoxylase-like metal-dependent hydrolase (beta-lactamase superfamily II)